MLRIGLGGGCHWCTEAIFGALKGAERVEQGFIGSVPPDEALSEAVRVTFSSARLSLEVLIEVHLRTHASQSDHAMRGKYRSAIYAPDDGVARLCVDALDRLAPLFEKPLVTRVLPLLRFEASPERFREYYIRRPDAPFCRTHIDPKLRMLRERFSGSVRDGFGVRRPASLLGRSITKAVGRPFGADPQHSEFCVQYRLPGFRGRAQFCWSAGEPQRMSRSVQPRNPAVRIWHHSGSHRSTFAMTPGSSRARGVASGLGFANRTPSV